jgi:hypothetical protein
MLLEKLKASLYIIKYIYIIIYLVFREKNSSYL